MQESANSKDISRNKKLEQKREEKELKRVHEQAFARVQAATEHSKDNPAPPPLPPLPRQPLPPPLPSAPPLPGSAPPLPSGAANQPKSAFSFSMASKPQGVSSSSLQRLFSPLLFLSSSFFSLLLFFFSFSLLVCSSRSPHFRSRMIDKPLPSYPFTPVLRVLVVVYFCCLFSTRQRTPRTLIFSFLYFIILILFDKKAIGIFR